MAEEQEGNSPPQPIVIHASPSTLETEALPILEPSVSDSTPQDGTPQPTPTDAVVSPNDAQPNPTNYLAQAIERYEVLKSKSDPGNFLAAIGLALMFGGLFIGVTAMMDGLSGGSGDGVELCFGGLIFGALIGVAGLAQSTSHQEELKKALAEIKSLANLPEKKATSPHVLIGSILCGLGILVIGTVEVGFGGLLLLGGLFTFLFGALTGSTSEKPEGVLVAAKKEVLRRNE